MQPAAPEFQFPGDAAAEPAHVGLFTHEPALLRPALCADADGDFVVAWASHGGQGFIPPGDVYFQLIDRTGVPVGARVQVNSSVPGIGAEVACSADGSFTVVWSSYYSSPPADPGDIYARRFDADGAPLGSEFLVNTTTANEQHTPSICSDAAGNFVVAWLAASTTADYDLVLRRFDSAGFPLGGEILAHSIEAAWAPNQRSISLACDPFGNFVLASIEFRSSIGTWAVWAQRFDSTAAPVGSELLVSDPHLEQIVDQVDVALSADGSFAVSWNLSLAYLRQYDAGGVPIAPPGYLQLDAAGHGCVGAPSLAIDANGRLRVVSGCQAIDGEPDAAAIATWQFDASGVALGDPSRVNTSLLGMQRFPMAAIAPDDDFLVVWIDQRPEPVVLAAQFFCDPADSECDICPGHDNLSDADSDGIPDGCDTCTNPDGGSGPTQAAKLILKRLEVPNFPFGSSSGKASLRLTTDFTTASPTAFSLFDPVADGARVVVSASDGGAVVDARLPATAYTPGGAGWKSNSTGTKWIYRDKTAAPLRGIVKVVLTDRTLAAGPGNVRARVVGKHSIYPAMVTTDPPMRFAIVLGDEGAAQSGSCADIAFGVAQCDVQLTRPAITCSK